MHNHSYVDLDKFHKEKTCRFVSEYGRRKSFGQGERGIRGGTVQDLHELFAGDRFFLIEVVRKLVQLFAVGGQKVDRFLVLLLDEGDNLAVDVAVKVGRAG